MHASIAPFRLYSLAQSSGLCGLGPTSVCWVGTYAVWTWEEGSGFSLDALCSWSLLHSFMFSRHVCVIIVGVTWPQAWSVLRPSWSRPSALSCLSFFITLSTFTFAFSQCVSICPACPPLTRTRGPCFCVGTPTLASPASSPRLVLLSCADRGPACVG